MSNDNEKPLTKLVLPIFGVAAIGTGALWWLQRAKASAPAMGDFTAEAPWNASFPDTLAIYCSDGRFTRPVEDLTKHDGHARLDTLTLPGGPAMLVDGSSNDSDHDTVVRALAFLVKGHDLKHVVLIAHKDCGYYKATFPSFSKKELLERQIADLEAARAKIQAKFMVPPLTVDCYYATPENGRVVFRKI